MFSNPGRGAVDESIVVVLVVGLLWLENIALPAAVYLDGSNEWPRVCVWGGGWKQLFKEAWCKRLPPSTLEGTSYLPQQPLPDNGDAGIPDHVAAIRASPPKGTPIHLALMMTNTFEPARFTGA